MIRKIERRKTMRKPAMIVVLATAGLGLLAQPAGATPLVRPAILADGAGSQEAIEVGWHGGGRGYGRGHHFHHRFYGRHGYYGYGYRPYPRYGLGWGYGGRHYFY